MAQANYPTTISVNEDRAQPPRIVPAELDLSRVVVAVRISSLDDSNAIRILERQSSPILPSGEVESLFRDLGSNRSLKILLKNVGQNEADPQGIAYQRPRLTSSPTCRRERRSF